MKTIKDESDVSLHNLLKLVAEIRPDQAQYVTGPKIKDFFVKEVRRQFPDLAFEWVVEAIKGMLTWHEGPIYLSTMMNWIRKYNKLMLKRIAEGNKISPENYFNG